jgi:uncharacterized membrane protein HdeD (DUF308 family)
MYGWIITIAGIISAVAGIMVVFNLEAGAAGISILLGIEVLVTGIALIALSLVKKSVGGALHSKIDELKRT